MITISVPCTFAAYNAKTGKLESSIITIGENTTILCNQDELKVPDKNTIFMATKSALITELKAKSIKNDDGTEITEKAI
jgi:hypothetical protein